MSKLISYFPYNEYKGKYNFWHMQIFLKKNAFCTPFYVFCKVEFAKSPMIAPSICYSHTYIRAGLKGFIYRIYTSTVPYMHTNTNKLTKSSMFYLYSFFLCKGRLYINTIQASLVTAILYI
jgi:hypothetical protein